MGIFVNTPVNLLSFNQLSAFSREENIAFYFVKYLLTKHFS